MKKELVLLSLLVVLAGCNKPLVDEDIKPLEGQNIISTEDNIAENTTENDTMPLLVFMANDQLDPEVSCQKVFPVERQVPISPKIAEAAINELLKGVTVEEKADGYATLINDGVKLNSISVENGVAKVDFDGRIEEATGGSCRVGMISRQIRETLLQFGTVQEVVISVEGRTEDILQP